MDENSDLESAKSEPLALAAADFIAELRHWREVRGYSQNRLGAAMDYDASYISKIEGGQQRPTSEFAKRGDQVLETAGVLFRRWREYQDHSQVANAQATISTTGGENRAGSDESTIPSSLTVQHEDARLSFENGVYRINTRRQLHNADDVPVTRFLIRIAVDRHPGKAEQSNELYRQRPLTWDELDLTANCEDERMAFAIKHDRDAFKELWLLFENDHGKFPLYPGETAWIVYGYSVSADKWGSWFQRAVRLPTKRMSVQLAFPAALTPAVWGLETSMTAEAVPVRTPITQRDEGDQRIFQWATENPALHSRFRFEWRFKDDGALNDPHVAPSERMRKIGVIQKGDSILTEPCEPFDLPKENELARSVGELLISYLNPLRAAHNFGKGMGLAAPQVGVARQAAVVVLPDNDPLVLYNPTIIDGSDETDERYEGCLSLFDVRGRVSRALRIDVEHTTPDGEQRMTTFENAAARLWAHEIDHLQGMLYTDRMAPDADPIPIEQYSAMGDTWRY